MVVFLLDFGQSEAGSGLLVDELSESCLSFDEGIGDSLLSAESRQEAHHLDGINVVSDDNKLGFVEFNQFGNVVETELDVDWLGGLELGFSLLSLGLALVVLLGILLVFAGLSILEESHLLVFFGFWAVF